MFRVTWTIAIFAICIVLSQKTVAQSTDAFRTGQILSANQMSKIPVTRQSLYEQTVGRVTSKAVLKYGTKEAYIQARGVKATAGKVFEAMTVNRFKAYGGLNGKRLVTTASLGFPGDASDILLELNGIVLDRYQLKAGFNASVNAVVDIKYQGIKIGTHPEQLEKIKSHIRKLHLQGKPLPPKWAMVDEAIRTGRLTDTLDGMPLSTRETTERFAQRYLERMFDNASHSNIRYISKLTGKSILIGASVADIAYSGYQFRDTVSRKHEFDSDIYMGKLVAQGGIGISGLGLLFIAFPEPTFLTKVAGGVLFASSLAFGVTDMTLDHAHANRITARQRLLKNLDTHEKHDAVDSLLRKMIDHDNASLY